MEMFANLTSERWGNKYSAAIGKYDNRVLVKGEDISIDKSLEISRNNCKGCALSGAEKSVDSSAEGITLLRIRKETKIPSGWVRRVKFFFV